MDTICEVINQLLEKSIHVTLIGLSRKADSDLNLEISDRLGGSRVTCLTYGEDDSDAIIEAFSRASLIVAMRFHALVLAIHKAAPTYTVAYSDKLEQICEWLEIEHYMQRVCFDKKLYYEKIIRLDIAKMLIGIDELLEDGEEISRKMEKKLAITQKETGACYKKCLYKLLDIS